MHVTLCNTHSLWSFLLSLWALLQLRAGSRQSQGEYHQSTKLSALASPFSLLTHENGCLCASHVSDNVRQRECGCCLFCSTGLRGLRRFFRDMRLSSSWGYVWEQLWMVPASSGVVDCQLSCMCHTAKIMGFQHLESNDLIMSACFLKEKIYASGDLEPHSKELEQLLTNELVRIHTTV